MRRLRAVPEEVVPELETILSPDERRDRLLAVHRDPVGREHDVREVDRAEAKTKPGIDGEKRQNLGAGERDLLAVDIADTVHIKRRELLHARVARPGLPAVEQVHESDADAALLRLADVPQRAIVFSREKRLVDLVNHERLADVLPPGVPAIRAHDDREAGHTRRALLVEGHEGLRRVARVEFPQLRIIRPAARLRRKRLDLGEDLARQRITDPHAFHRETPAHRHPHKVTERRPVIITPHRRHELESLLVGSVQHEPIEVRLDRERLAHLAGGLGAAHLHEFLDPVAALQREEPVLLHEVVTPTQLATHAQLLSGIALIRIVTGTLL